MPYASEIRVNSQSGSAPSSQMDITLWELKHTYDNQGRSRDEQIDQETVSVNVAGGTQTAFATMDGPSYLSRNHSMAMSAYQSGSPGPVFRTGQIDTLPTGSPGDPNGMVDVMFLDQMRFTMAEINAMIPTPITLPDGNIISTATLSSAPPSNELTLVATGPYGATTFTFTMMFTIDPSNDQFDLTKVLQATPSRPGVAGGATMTFAAGPGGGAQAFIDNLFVGLFIGSISGKVISTVTTKLNEAAATAAGNTAGRFGLTGLPEGIVLGVRVVAVASNGDIVMRPAIGAFGSIVNRILAALPAGSGGTSTSRCPTSTIALAALTPQLLPMLRGLRDGRLAHTSAGRELIALYYEHSAETVDILDRDPALLARATRVAVAATRDGVTADLLGAVAGLADEIACGGSAALRRAVERARLLATTELVLQDAELRVT